MDPIVVHLGAQHALDTHAEQGLLVTRVGYAEQSDRLARAMKEGGAAALHAFALFHRPLARSGARHMRRWFGLDEEEAEQIGMVAVLRAAKWFKPELGFQFSTYATPVIRRQCESDGPVEHLTIGMPATVYWRHARLAQRLDSLDARFGTGSAERCARWMAQRDSRFGEQWDRAARAIGVRSLSDRRSPAYRAALQLVAPQDQRSTETEYLIECLLAAVDRLPPGDAMIIRWRYGFEGTPLTLERVGEIIGRTRERVRQRQNESEKFIRAFVLAKLGVRDGGSSEGLESIDVADARLDATEAAATGQRIDETDDDADTQTAKGRTHRRPSRGIVHPHAV